MPIGMLSMVSSGEQCNSKVFPVSILMKKLKFPEGLGGPGFHRSVGSPTSS